MKTLKLISITVLLFALASCGITSSVGSLSLSGKYEIGSKKWISGYVFQTINKHEALVETGDVDVYIVTPSNSKEFLFDELQVGAYYIFVGTHQYKTVNKEFVQYKTVPVFVEKRYYIKGMEWDDLNKTLITP